MPDKEPTIPRDWLPVTLWPNYFHDKQKEFVNSDKWQTWMIAGNGTGKTHVLFWSVTALAMGVHPMQMQDPKMMPPVRICCIEPDYDKVLDVALEKLQSPQLVQPAGVELGPMLPPSLVSKGYSKDHRQITLKNGSQILFVTNEQGWQAMRGKQFDFLAVDEECDQRVFDENLRGLRNAKGGGRVLAGLTPPYEPGCGPTWTKEAIVDSAINNRDLCVINCCMADNPAITEEFIRRFSKGKTKEQIDVQVYGRYPSWGDLVHPDFQDRLWNKQKCEGHLIANDFPMPEHWEVDWVMAFDWHQSKPCAAVFGWVDRDGNVFIFDELDIHVAKGKTIDELAEVFKAIEGHPHTKRNFRRWQDPSAKSQYNAVQRGFNAWDAFRQVGIVTSAGKNRDPDVGISIVNDYLRGNTKEHPRLFIFERCKNLRQFLNNHYWKRDTSGKGKPDPRWSDYPITVRYILQDIGWAKSRNKRKKWPLVSYKKPDPNKHIIDLGRIF